MNFLFRLPNSHAFITTEDPEYRYEVLCGRCEFPLAHDDERCPRCQVYLEDCPVCSLKTHTKAPRVTPDGRTGARLCPVCKIRRFPFGEQSLDEMEGSFCTNLYGCPAGGLLLKSEELAVLPPEASLCPICENAALKPLDLRTYRYLISRCVFCKTCLGPIPAWPKGWSKEWMSEIDALEEPAPRDHTLCPICGRNDVLDGKRARIVSIAIDPRDQDARLEVPVDYYLRVLELGRILILETEDRTAFNKAFKTWFDANVAGLVDTRVSVARIGQILQEGTLNPESLRVLKRRMQSFFDSWARKLPNGMEYLVSTHSTSQPRPLPPPTNGPEEGVPAN